MKTLLAALFSLFLTACAPMIVDTKDVSPSFQWDSYTVTGEILKHIEVDQLTGARKWTFTLVVYFNGKPLIRGGLDPYSFQGVVSNTSSPDNPLSAACTSVRKGADWWDVTCAISHRGTHIGDLHF